MPSVPHPPELIARARELWEAGLPVMQIAAQLRMTKNALVGMAHRRSFPPRPNPVKQIDAPLAAMPAEVLQPIPRAPRVPPPPPPVAPPPPPPSQWPADRGCRWPLWADDARPDGRFCQAPCRPWPSSNDLRPPTYCGAHLRRVIAPRRQGNEAA